VSVDVGPQDTGPGPDAAEPVESGRIHGGMSLRPDDERYEELVAGERAKITGPGYDPADVPPAEDPERVVDVTDTEQYRSELSELRRQRAAGELITEGRSTEFPPTSYGQG